MCACRACSTADAASLCACVPQMPRLDGLEATKQFRSWERAQPPPAAGGARARLPIIALSANVFHETIADCTAAGMDGAAPWE